MKNVFVAIDGSERSEKALNAAFDFARTSDGTLFVAHVTGRHSISAAEDHLAEVEFASKLKNVGFNVSDVAESAIIKSQIASFLQDHYDREETIKELVGNQILTYGASRAKEAGIKSVQTLLLSGDPADAIIKAAKQAKADVIVVAARGHGEVASLILGSVSHRLVNSAPISVLVVK